MKTTGDWLRIRRRSTDERRRCKEAAGVDPGNAAGETVSLPLVVPMPLGRGAAPFDHPDFIFEPKLDGYRAVAYLVEQRPAVRPGMHDLPVQGW